MRFGANPSLTSRTVAGYQDAEEINADGTHHVAPLNEIVTPAPNRLVTRIALRDRLGILGLAKLLVRMTHFS